MEEYLSKPTLEFLQVVLKQIIFNPISQENMLVAKTSIGFIYESAQKLNEFRTYLN